MVLNRFSNGPSPVRLYGHSPSLVPLMAAATYARPDRPKTGSQPLDLKRRLEHHYAVVIKSAATVAPRFQQASTSTRLGLPDTTT